MTGSFGVTGAQASLPTGRLSHIGGVGQRPGRPRRFPPRRARAHQRRASRTDAYPRCRPRIPHVLPAPHPLRVESTRRAATRPGAQSCVRRSEVPDPRPRYCGSATFSLMPGNAQHGGVDLAGLLYLAIVLAVLFLPVLLGRGSAPPRRPDSESDGGWGKDPPQPPGFSPSAPSDGIPLADAEPARVRLRSHGRLRDRIPARDRRPAREPDREPARR
jgi:hypothetical protein